jgi:hypothetical protein
MPFFSVAVTRGGKKPFEVLFTSSIAEESGEIVPIPTCAFIDIVTINSKQKTKIDLIVVFILVGFDSIF